MSPSGIRQSPCDNLRQFSVTRYRVGPRAWRAQIRRVGFMSTSVKRGLPSTESARCSLLGEAERLAVGQSLRKAPKFLVQPDVAVQSGDGACAREAFATGTAARLVFQPAAQEIFADPIQDPPKIVAGVFVATCLKQLLRSDRRLLHIFITEAQRGPCERSRFGT